MVLTSDNDVESTRDAVVTIRIPNGTDESLVAHAMTRISRADAVRTVTVQEVRELDPRLSATVATIGVRLEVVSTTTADEVGVQVSAVSGVESVEQIE
jgi:hypothetical protein